MTIFNKNCRLILYSYPITEILFCVYLSFLTLDGCFLSPYARFLCGDIVLYYRNACANNLEPLNILNAICLHMVSQMFLRIVVNRALYAPSYK
jgi:hypothetical protein